jgi:hypothetical protein
MDEIYVSLEKIHKIAKQAQGYADRAYEVADMQEKQEYLAYLKATTKDLATIFDPEENTVIVRQEESGIKKFFK